MDLIILINIYSVNLFNNFSLFFSVEPVPSDSGVHLRTEISVFLDNFPVGVVLVDVLPALHQLPQGLYFPSCI